MTYFASELRTQKAGGPPPNAHFGGDHGEHMALGKYFELEAPESLESIQNDTGCCVGQK